MTQNKVLTFKELEAKYQPNDSFWLKIGFDSRNDEIEELKKKLDEAVDVIKFCNNNQSLFLVWNRVKNFLKRNEL